MNTTSLLPPPRADRSAERRAHLAARWSAGGAALSGVGGLAALVAGLTGHGATSTVTHPALSLTHTLPHHQVAVMLGVAGLLIAVGLLLQGALARAVGRGDARPGLTSPRLALVVAAPLLAAVALAAACDANPLAFLGYLPSVGVGSLFSAEMRASWSTLPWLPMIAQLTVIATAVVSVVTSIRVADALRGDAPRPRWQQPASAARWGRTAVAAAVAIPLLYAFTRIAWVLGWQIGFDADAYADSGGDATSGLFLAIGAIVGSVLTIGLVRPWGERFWTWLPALGGRRVPVGLAVVPASVVAAMLLAAGVSMIVAAVDQLGVGSIGSLADNWAAIGVTFLWPIWSLALALATWAYALRRG